MVVSLLCGFGSGRLAGTHIEEKHQHRVRVALAGGVGHRQRDYTKAGGEDAVGEAALAAITWLLVRDLGKRRCAPTSARGRTVAEADCPARQVSVGIGAANPSKADGERALRRVAEESAGPMEEARLVAAV